MLLPSDDIARNHRKSLLSTRHGPVRSGGHFAYYAEFSIKTASHRRNHNSGFVRSHWTYTASPTTRCDRLRLESPPND